MVKKKNKNMYLILAIAGILMFVVLNQQFSLLEEGYAMYGESTTVFTQGTLTKDCDTSNECKNKMSGKYWDVYNWQTEIQQQNGNDANFKVFAESAA